MCVSLGVILSNVKRIEAERATEREKNTANRVMVYHLKNNVSVVSLSSGGKGETLREDN